MHKALAVFSVAALVVACMLVPVARAAAAPPTTELGIITGSEKGTYYQFGLNLQALAKRSGVAVTVHPSRGSIENVNAVYERPGVQLGIVQSDVLAFVTRMQADPTLKRIAKKTRMVFPLYNEEVHLVGRRGIATFDDLADRRVAVGREGSGTYLTARLLFNVAEVTPREMVYIDTDEALAELKAGRIDAMFYVAGAPVRLFADSIADSDNLALIPITNKSIVEFYPRVELPAKTYAWQASAVPTVAVKSVLISFDFRRQDCESVGRFGKLISDNMSWLTTNGHAKWKSVDLDFPLKGWEQYDCVRKYLGKSVAAPHREGRSTKANPVMDAVKHMLGE
jgi:TRAP transporter TAXI family solute receptor